MEFDLVQAALLLAVGIAGGFINVMAGGGSMLTVPVMLFLGMPGPVANGTNRIAILAQNIIAVGTFFKRGYSNFALSVTLAAATLPGAIIGAFAGTRLDGEWFDRTVAAIMVAVLISMALPKRKRPDKPAAGGAAPEELPRSRLIMGHLGMVLVGFWGGFIQLGVGFIIMPIMNRVMGLSLVHVNMHKVFIVAVYTVVALAVFAATTEIRWALGAALAIGMGIGGWLGARSSIGGGEKLIRVVLYVTLTVFIIRLLFF